MNYLLTGEETERLSFRLLVEDDFNTWVNFFEAKDVAKFLLMDPHLSPTELCQKWFEKSLGRYDQNLGGMNVLIDKHTDEFIGQCGLLIQDIEGDRFLEIGYSILPKFWNQGYATEAAIKCRDFAFEQGYTDSLISLIHKENYGSEKVAINNGMVLFKNTLKEPNESFNMFRIEKKEWEKKLRL